MERYIKIIPKQKDKSPTPISLCTQSLDRETPSTLNRTIVEPEVVQHSPILESNSSLDDQENNNNASSPPTKKSKYERKVPQNWKDIYQWIEFKDNEAMCRICNIIVKGSGFHMKRHENSSIHKKKDNSIKSTPKVSELITNNDNQTFRRYTLAKEAQMKLAAYICEHNLPFIISDTLPLLFVDMFPDSEVAKDVQMKRKKATETVTNTLAPYVFSKLVGTLRKTRFSIIIDESTDIGTQKNLVVVCRLWDEVNSCVKDRFLALSEVHNSSADGIFQLIKNIFDENGLSFTNLIGFGADNANVMMGNIGGVKAKLKDISPDIVCIGCTCHSLHLCASYAAKQLPSSVEQFARDIYNFFGNSSKRLGEFKECQIFAEENPTKILYPSQTRWLSLKVVVTRILEHWSSLILYFQRVALEEKLISANNILSALRNKIYKVYLNFLSYVLEIVTKMNVEFQSESPRLPLLHEQMSSLYKTILKSFIKRNILDENENNLGKLNIRNTKNYLKLEEIYFGAKVQLYMDDPDLDKKDLHDFKIRALDFYIELCTQLRNKFDFQDPYLIFASKFAPKNAMSGEILSIAEFKRLFPYLDVDPDTVGIEWQLLSEIRELKNKFANHEVLEFWKKVSNLKNGLDQLMFPNLMELVKIILSLPHSSAVCERHFSQVNLIKTPLRNRLLVKTCEVIMHVKDQLRNGGFDFKKIKETKK